MTYVPILFYAIVKYLAYSGWCAVLPERVSRPWWRRGFGLGLVRLALGIAVGGCVAAAGAHLAFAARSPIPFLAMLLPVRWLEWSVTALVGSELPLLPHFVLLGPSGRARLWMLGGMAVSFATDVVAIIAMGTMRALVC